jgi:dephospho-CoA kinase
MIIGIAGTLGAGKGTVVERLKKEGFTHYSSSAILRQVLVERGQEQTRSKLSELANELMEKHEGGILSLSHGLAQKNKDQNYILESLHRVSEAEYIKKIGGIILGVDADIHLRYQRAILRQEGEKDNVTFEQFLADSEREEEGKVGDGPNIRAVMAMADYTIFNDGTLAELEEKVNEFLKQYGN